MSVTSSWTPILDNSEGMDQARGAGTGVWGALPSNSGVSEAGSQTSHPANKQCKKKQQTKETVQALEMALTLQGCVWKWTTVAKKSR